MVNYASPIFNNVTTSSITGLTTPLSMAQGGTGANSASSVRSNLGLGTAALLSAGGANGVAILDALGNASAMSVLATGATIARALSSISADAINAKNYGLILNGTTSDSATLQTLYNGTPSNSTINVPTGNWNASLTSNPSKSIHWNLLGTLDYGTSAAGTNPVAVIGDGDVVSCFIAGRYQHSKVITASTNGYAVLSSFLTNQSSSQFAAGYVVGNLVLNTASKAGCSGYTWGVNSTLSAGATGGNNNQDVCIQSTVYRPHGAAGATWQFGGNTVDLTGLAPNSPSSIIGFESDINSNGSEIVGTQYNPNIGSRTFYHIVANAQSWPSWPGASQAVSLGTIITGSASGVLVTFLCTTAGITGSSQPTWPSSGLITDGTVVWTYGTTFANQVANGIKISTDSNTSIGTGLSMLGNYYGSLIDLSWASMTGSAVAALRLAPNMPIDFSGAGTLATLNLRTLAYNSGAGALEYITPSGTVLISDDGSISARKFISNFSATQIGFSVFGSGGTGFDTSNATFSGMAYRMAAGQFFGLEATNTYKFQFVANTDTLQFQDGAAISFSLQLTTGNITMASGSMLFGAASSFTTISASGAITGSGAITAEKFISNFSAGQIGFSVSGSGGTGFDTSTATFTGPAYRMAAGQTFGVEATGVYGFSFVSATDILQFTKSGLSNFSINLNNGNIIMASGASLQLGSAYTSGAPTATGYVTVVDSSGVSRKLLCA